MSIEDEVKAKQEEMLKQQAAKEKKEAFDKELIANGFLLGQSAHLMYPDQSFTKVIDEALPSLVFDKPKIVRVLSDGNVYIRLPKDGETADTYSFEIPYPYNYFTWIFSNGTFANSNGHDFSISPDQLRKDIIKALAAQRLNSPKAENPKIDTMWENSTEAASILKKLKESKQAEEERLAAEIENKRLEVQKNIEAFERKERKKIKAEQNCDLRMRLLWAAFWVLTAFPFYSSLLEGLNSNVWCYIYLIVYFAVVFRLNFKLTLLLENELFTTPFHPLSILTAIASFVMTVVFAAIQNISLWLAAVDLLAVIIAIVSANWIDSNANRN